MLVEELDIGPEFKEVFAEIGVSELYPPQKLSVDAGILDGKNIILCTPTASGKTIAAELGIIKSIERGKKAVYIVPLRALAYEKYHEFKKYEQLGYRVRMEVGDLDSSKYGQHADFDILVATAEKCDSILRSKPGWFEGAGTIVLDEIHMIASDRGPVYEILTAKFIRLYPDVQVLGLSATVGNAQELADWLNAELVVSEWRPVELDEKVIVKTEQGLGDVVAESLKDGQALVFVNSRKSAEAVAEKLAGELTLKADNEELAEEILSAINPPTRQCKRLASCVRGGTAFHHAGLVNSQRVAVEDAFKRGDIKVISATPTLAAGVNLPSRTVVLRDVKRYTSGGLTYINILEYKQMVGRAGRPRYDDKGHAITLAKDDGEAEYIMEHYVGGEAENIYSQLGVQPVLRFHALASIASGFCKTHESLVDFIRTTFFGHQYGVKKELEELLKSVCEELIKWEFIQVEGRFLNPTGVGQRVSELYIDPLTAHNYITLLSPTDGKGGYDTVGLLEVICDAAEMNNLQVSQKEERVLWESAYGREDGLLRDLSGFGLDFEFLNRFKTSLMINEWLEEKTEDEIMDGYNVTPGQLNMHLKNLEWLTYSAVELMRILKLKKTQLRLKNLETRVKYGVKEELIPLVSVKGIGRVRARKLYQDGIKTVLQLKKTPKKELAKLVGEKTAENIIKQL